MRVYESTLEFGPIKAKCRFSAKDDSEALQRHGEGDLVKIPGVIAQLFDVTTGTRREVLLPT